MISRLEIARMLFGYDPETTPQQELQQAKADFRSAIARCDFIKQQLADFVDEAIYEVDCENEVFIRRDIHKITPKRIVLDPRFEGDKRQYLPRQSMEAGNRIFRGRGLRQPSFASGATVRESYEPLLERANQQAFEWLLRIAEIEQAIEDDEIALDPESMRTIEIFWTDLNGRQKVTQAAKIHDWIEEGF